MRYHLLAVAAILCCACSPKSVSSGDRSVKTVLSDTDGVLRYSVTFHDREVIAPSELGIVLNGDTLGKKAALKLVSKEEINEEYATRGIHSLARNHGIEYTYDIKDAGTNYQIQMRVYDDGVAFRYLFSGSDPVRVNSELTSFRVPTDTPVWFFERTDGTWKLKTYAGDWTRTTSEKLCSISPSGPVQGGPLVYELPDGKYMAITEAALYDYSGMRFLTREDASLQADFTEGKEGFMVEGTFSTPWRVIMLADDLNELVNCDLVSNLNPAPDRGLFPDISWIKPGRVTWSWWSDCEDYMTVPLERHFVDAARELGFEYSLLDEGWERWPDKWAQLKDICDYAHERGVNMMVWKHADQIKSPENNYAVMAAFLDSVKTAGASGVKIDFMNGESKSLVDFDIKALQLCAERELLVDFHGCQKPSGESRTYPNEITREGIRGLELNRMNKPLTSNHNVALVFTRCLLGNADYTPVGFTRPGNTTFAHQLATAFAFTSPLTVIGEHVDVLLNDERVAPMLPLIKALPSTWDETIVLPQSSISSLALLARRSGEDWYLVALNGDKAQTISVPMDFLGEGKWNTYEISDSAGDPTKVEFNEENIDSRSTLNIQIAAGGGYVAKIEKGMNFRVMVQPVPRTAVMADPEYFIWGGTMVKDDKGTYHLFYSRWKKELGFASWVTYSEVAHATAPSPFGPFTHRDVALPARGAEYWDGFCTHNPTIHKFGKRYYLYYMGNTGDGKVMPNELNFVHRNNQRIGVAVADDPNGPWTRFDEPLIDVSADDSAPDALMTSNPAVTECPDGSYLIVYKAVGKQRPMPFGGPVVHLTATSDSPTGPFTKQLKPTFLFEGVDFPAEDPYIWSQNGRIYALVKDNHGNFTKQGKSLALFESKNGMDWTLARHPFAMGLTFQWESGEVAKMSNLERPQLLFEDGEPVSLLMAAGLMDDNGIMLESYNIQIPLKKK